MNLTNYAPALQLCTFLYQEYLRHKGEIEKYGSFPMVTTVVGVTIFTLGPGKAVRILLLWIDY